MLCAKMPDNTEILKLFWRR